jgi:beta-lactamase regulating signal transducer with metallopeptidase domain
MMALIANHIWQSTIFGGLTALAVLALGRNRAAVRYRLWQIASLKFLVPFALLSRAGGDVSRDPGAGRRCDIGRPQVRQIGETDMVQRQMQPGVHAAASSAGTLLTSVVPSALVAVWAAGFGVTLLTWAIRWRRMTHIIRSAPTLEGGREVERLRALEHAAGATCRLRLVVVDSLFEPGVFGVLRPVLVWPRTLSDHLSDTQIDAVLAHELAHALPRQSRRGVHMFVRRYWFHPMVWWMGSRLLDERERACDADVVEQGATRDLR